jgi:hypothetical protein
MSSDLSIRFYENFDELPESFAPLLEQAEDKGFFHTQPWFEFLMEYVWEHDALRLYTVEDADGRPLLLAPLRLTGLDGAVPFAKTLASIGHQENFSVLCLLFNPVAEITPLQVLTVFFQALRDPKKAPDPFAIDVLRLWPVEADSDLAAMIEQALRESGYRVQAYANSFNRYEDTSGVGFEDYFASRSSNHRYNVRRRQRNMEKAGELEIDIYANEISPEELQGAIDDYVIGTVECWQSPASLSSRPMLNLMRRTADTGSLRLGVLKFKGRPIAGQFWIVSGGVAHCMRLAFNEDYKKWAPGVVLTSHILAHVLDKDHVDKIDFGLGAEEYKEKWMKGSRDYSGFMAFNPATPRGAFFGAKHIIGQPVKRFLSRALRFVLRPFFGS